MPQKIAFFEEICTMYDALIDNYLKNQFIIYFFGVNGKYGNSGKIKKYIKAGTLIDVSPMIFEYELYRRAAFLAHENVDAIFETYFSSSPAIENMARLLEFHEIENMYIKELLFVIEQVYGIELKINEILKNCEADEIHFVPHSYIEIHSDSSSPLRKDIRIVEYKNFAIHLNDFFNRLKRNALLGYPVFLTLKKIRGVSNNKKREEFKVGISIVPHPKSIFDMNYLTESIFVDDIELPKEYVLFIDENGDKNIAGYNERGFNYTRLIDDREIITRDLFLKIFRRFYPAWFKSLLYSLSEAPFITVTTRKILTDYIKWNLFADSYKIHNYVRRTSPDNMSQIHVLRQHGVKTCFLYPDNSSHDFHLDWSPAKKNVTVFSLMYYDTAVIYGDIVERFFRKHRNLIKDYVKIGVIYSQIVRQLKEGALDSSLPSAIRNKGLPERIIGVFDTTYGDRGAAKIKDGIRFGNDILKLLDDFPDIGIVFKAIKWPEQIPYLNSIYDKIKNHERCLVFYMWDKEGISASEVIAFSDFVISAAYTSPSAEALGAKRKAIYYDVARHEIGDKYYYNNYPNFVAHDYDELKKLVNYWLNEVTDEEFEDFLNTYVKDEIDPYLDGQALTRFRRLLGGIEHAG